MEIVHKKNNEGAYYSLEPAVTVISGVVFFFFKLIVSHFFVTHLTNQFQNEVWETVIHYNNLLSYNNSEKNVALSLPTARVMVIKL